MKDIAERLKTRNENFQAVAAQWKSPDDKNCKARENVDQNMDTLVESVNKAIEHKDLVLATTTMSDAAKKDGLISLLENHQITRALLEGGNLPSIIEEWARDPQPQNMIGTFVVEIQ